MISTLSKIILSVDYSYYGLGSRLIIWEFNNVLSQYNPFFHMIDGFRYSFINNMDGSIKFSLIYLIILSILTWFIAYKLYKKGYKIKS